MLTLFAGLINWLVTTIFVESKLFEPIRNFVIYESYYCDWDGKRYKCGGRHSFIFPEGTTQAEAEAHPPYMYGPWVKVAQLVTCQLCTRVWVGFAEAAYFGGPLHGSFPIIANGLLYAAVGHLIFELRSRVALVVPQEQT
jgi:hypothetical protein